MEHLNFNHLYYFDASAEGFTRISTKYVTSIRGLLERREQAAVFFVDSRVAPVLSQDVASTLITVMKEDNEDIERTAVLVGNHATLRMQMNRMWRDAGSTKRRGFDRVEDLYAWLGVPLSQEEKNALRDFLRTQDAS